MSNSCNPRNDRSVSQHGAASQQSSRLGWNPSSQSQAPMVPAGGDAQEDRHLHQGITFSRSSEFQPSIKPLRTLLPRPREADSGLAEESTRMISGVAHHQNSLERPEIQLQNQEVINRGVPDLPGANAMQFNRGPKGGNGSGGSYSCPVCLTVISNLTRAKQNHEGSKACARARKALEEETRRRKVLDDLAANNLTEDQVSKTCQKCGRQYKNEVYRKEHQRFGDACAPPREMSILEYAIKREISEEVAPKSGSEDLTCLWPGCQYKDTFSKDSDLRRHIETVHLGQSTRKRKRGANQDSIGRNSEYWRLRRQSGRLSYLIRKMGSTN
ncbi:hypothetical protein T439DRAFT_30437 [Meredithblackwellia eburnea MCA 4105]